MTPIGHFAIGYAAKQASPKIHLGLLLGASWILDLLYFIFAFLGVESMENIRNPGAVPSPWSHGLFMAVIWSVLFGLLAGWKYRSRKIGLVISMVVFSHWVLDFLSWNNMLLFFEQSPQVGLGLFNVFGGNTIFLELALFLVGFLIYMKNRKRTRGHVLVHE